MERRSKEARTEKLQYAAPKLTVYGNIERLTTGVWKPDGTGDYYDEQSLSPL